MLGSLEHDTPSYDQSELDSMLGEARRRSAALQRRRHRQRRSGAGAAALAVAVLIAVTSIASLGSKGGGGSPGRVVAAPAWKTVSEISEPSWQVLSSDGYQPGVGLTCPDATTCYLEDFSSSPGQNLQVEVTRDGGKTWQQLSLPGDIGWLGRGLSCLDGETCFALGEDGAGDNVVVRTDDGGRSWTTEELTLVPPSANLSGMSCSSATTCVVVGASYDLGSSFALHSTDGGQSWSESALPDDFVPLRVACGAGDPCLVSGFSRQSFNGGVLSSTDGGGTWTPAQLPAGTPAVTSISCGDATHCLATTMGNDVVIGKHRARAVGADWRTRAPLAKQHLRDDGRGLSWHTSDTSAIAPSLLTSLSSATVSYCWTSGVIPPAPDGHAAGQSAMSPSEIPVLASGNGVLATTEDAGASWQSAQLPPDLRAVASVACPDPTNCYAVGFTSPDPGSSASNRRSGATGSSGFGGTGPAGQASGSFVFLLLEPASR